MLASNIKIPCPLSATATRNRHAKWTSPLYRENTGTTSLRPSFPRSSMYVVCNRGCKLICHMPHVYNSVSSAALPLDARLVTSRNLVWTISRARFPNNRGLFFLVYFKHVRFCQRAEVSTRFFFFFRHGGSSQYATVPRLNKQRSVLIHWESRFSVHLLHSLLLRRLNG
jgi:hypothetical protein